MSSSPPIKDGTVKRKRAKYILNIDKLPGLPEAEKAKLKEVAKKFAFRTNDNYVSLIDWKDPNDPIRRLVIPDERELNDWGILDASIE